MFTGFTKFSTYTNPVTNRILIKLKSTSMTDNGFIFFHLIRIDNLLSRLIYHFITFKSLFYVKHVPEQQLTDPPNIAQCKKRSRCVLMCLETHFDN